MEISGSVALTCFQHLYMSPAMIDMPGGISPAESFARWFSRPPELSEKPGSSPGCRAAPVGGRIRRHISRNAQQTIFSSYTLPCGLDVANWTGIGLQHRGLAPVRIAAIG